MDKRNTPLLQLRDSSHHSGGSSRFGVIHVANDDRTSRRPQKGILHLLGAKGRPGVTKNRKAGDLLSQLTSNCYSNLVIICGP